MDRLKRDFMNEEQQSLSALVVDRAVRIISKMK